MDEHSWDDPLTTASEGARAEEDDFAIDIAGEFAGDIAGEAVLGPRGAASSAASSAGPMAGYVGEFRIIREVGRGGMGIVYEAEQMSLGRRVALKILPMANVLDGRQLVRFKNEARAAATLVHPHIVPVFSIGCERGVHYYAMQFIEGRSLAEVIAGLRIEAGATGPGQRIAPPVATPPVATPPVATPQSATASDPPVHSQASPAGSSKSTAAALRSSETSARMGMSTERSGGRRRRQCVMAARWGADIADALEHAHSLGVVHRDIKPANLLLDQEGKIWVADFGLAQLEADAGMTMTGDVLGTLRYMSPEQAQGNRALIDGHSDVYSLGISLYELLTLRAAFSGSDRARVLRQVIEEEPPLPRSIDPQVPRDLETVVLKAIAKEPHARYASAKELADDLRRFVANEPIRAKRPTVWDRLTKWTRRHRPLVGVAMVLLLVLCAILAVGLSMIERQRVLAVENERIAQDAARVAESLQIQAEQRGEHIERLLYMSDMKLAALAWEKGDLQQYTQLLETHRPGVGTAGRRGFEWNYLWRRGNMEHRQLTAQEGPVHVVRFSPDGRKLAIGCEDGDVLLFDAASDEGVEPSPQVLLRTSPQRTTSVAFSPDGERIAAASYDGTVRVSALDTGSPQWRISAHSQGEAYDVIFAPDGRSLISCGSEPVVRVWDSSNGRPLEVLQSRHDAVADRTQKIYGLAISPDGQLLASAGGPDSHTLMIWNLATRTEKYMLQGHERRICAVAFSADGRYVASASVDKTVRLWDLSSEREQKKAGRREVFVGEHLDSVRSIAFSPDGRWLVTGDWNGAIRLWTLSSLDTAAVGAVAPDHSTDPALAWQAHSGRINSLAFSPNGEGLVSAGRDGKVHLWSLGSQTQRALKTPPKQSTTRGSAFTADGRFLIQAYEGAVAMYDPATGKVMKILTVETQPRRRIALSTDGSRLFIGDGPGTVAVWDLEKRERIAQWRAKGAGSHVDPQALSPDGSTLAVTDWSNDTLWLFDTTSGEATGLPAEQCHAAEFINEGKEVAVDSLDDIVIWNIADQREVDRLRGHNSTIESLALSPEGRRLASCSRDRQIKIWDTKTGRELQMLSSHRDDVTAVAFSPDGQSLVSGDCSGSLLVWEVENGRLVCELEQLSGEISHVEFSPDGGTIACQLIGTREPVVLLDVSPLSARELGSP